LHPLASCSRLQPFMVWRFVLFFSIRRFRFKLKVDYHFKFIPKALHGSSVNCLLVSEALSYQSMRPSATPTGVAWCMRPQATCVCPWGIHVLCDAPCDLNTLGSLWNEKLVMNGIFTARTINF
jgi:hypothetical protein